MDSSFQLRKHHAEQGESSPYQEGDFAIAPGDVGMRPIPGSHRTQRPDSAFEKLILTSVGVMVGG